MIETLVSITGLLFCFASVVTMITSDDKADKQRLAIWLMLLAIACWV